jgi:hypothetical protein
MIYLFSFFGFVIGVFWFTLGGLLWYWLSFEESNIAHTPIQKAVQILLTWPAMLLNLIEQGAKWARTKLWQ